MDRWDSAFVVVQQHSGSVSLSCNVYAEGLLSGPALSFLFGVSCWLGNNKVLIESNKKCSKLENWSSGLVLKLIFLTGKILIKVMDNFQGIASWVIETGCMFSVFCKVSLLKFNSISVVQLFQFVDTWKALLSCIVQRKWLPSEDDLAATLNKYYHINDLFVLSVIPQLLIVLNIKGAEEGGGRRRKTNAHLMWVTWSFIHFTLYF